MTTPNSFSGSAQATTLTGTGIGASDSTFTIASVSTWKETIGSNIGSYLGTSGNFVVTIDYGTSSEEKVLCSGPITSTTINVVTRGYDGATPGTGVAHSAGAVVVHTISTDVPYFANLGATVAAAALPKAGGTMTGAIAMGANKITNLAAGTTTTDATNYTQLSAVSTVANGTQLATGTGKLSGTIPSTATPLRVIGWTQSITVATAASGIGVAIPSGFTNALMSVVGTYANEGTSGVGLRVVIDTNGSATDSFKAWIYNAAGTRVATTGVFSFVAVGY